MSDEEEEERVTGVPVEDEEILDGDDLLEERVSAGVPIPADEISLFTPESLAEGSVRPPPSMKRVSNPPPPLPPMAARKAPPPAPLPVRRPGPQAALGAPPPPPPKTPKKAVPPRKAARGKKKSEKVDFDDILTVPVESPKAKSDDERIEFSLEPEKTAKPAESEGGGGGRVAVVALLLAGAAAAVWFFVIRPPQGAGEELAHVDLEPIRVDSPPAEEPPEVTEPEAAPETEPEPEPEPEPESNMEPATMEPVSAMRQPAGERPRMVSAMALQTTNESEMVAEMTPEPAEEADDSPYHGGTPARMEPEPEPENLPEHPSRDDVQSALSAVRGAVAACTNGQHGTIRVRVTAVGSGRVTTAVVQDPLWARPPTGSCIARAVRRARFPRFSETRFVVIYPFQI